MPIPPIPPIPPIRLHSALNNLPWSVAGHTIDTAVNLLGNKLQGNNTSGGNLTLSSTSHATKGKIYFGNAATSYWDEANNKVLLYGSSAQGILFSLVKEWSGVSSTNLVGNIDCYGDVARFLLRRANGTVGTPTQLLANDIISSLQYRGHDGTQFNTQPNAAINAVAEENFTSTAQGTRLIFATCPIGSLTPVLNTRLNNAGRWHFAGNATAIDATAIVHLGAGTATASTPPMKFTQGTNLTTPEAGAVEYDGTDISLTSTTDVTRRRIVHSHSLVAPSGITVGASPYVFQNTLGYDISVIVQGGTVSAIAFSRDNTTYYTIGTTAGMFELSPNDYLKVTYSSTPTMTKIPR